MARKPPSPNTNCTICGRQFYVSPGHKKRGWGRFCGFECRSKGTGGVNHLNYKPKEGLCHCKECGKPFHQKPTSIRSGRHRQYCSSECRISATIVTLTCSGCGVQWELPRSVAKNKRKWCSQACKVAFNAKRTNCKCITCGKDFYTKEANETRRRRKPGVGSFCSNHCKHKYMSSSAMTISGKYRGKHGAVGGRRPDLDNRYFRSRWEANYARYLNWLVEQGQIVRWEYEPDTFEFPVKRGNRLYTPDFKVFNNDGTFEYHEVKGWMDPGSITKLKRMRIHHKHIKMVVIDAKYYRALSKQIGDCIPNWERCNRGTIHN